jgi:hypothetical protein
VKVPFWEMLISDVINGWEWTGNKRPTSCKEKEKYSSDMFDVVVKLDAKIFLLYPHASLSLSHTMEEET